MRYVYKQSDKNTSVNCLGSKALHRCSKMNCFLLFIQLYISWIWLITTLWLQHAVEAGRSLHQRWSPTPGRKPSSYLLCPSFLALLLCEIIQAIIKWSNSVYKYFSHTTCTIMSTNINKGEFVTNTKNVLLNNAITF